MKICGSSAGGLKRFLSFLKRPSLRLNHVSIKWVPGTLSPGIKRSERDSDHSVPSVMIKALYASECGRVHYQVTSCKLTDGRDLFLEGLGIQQLYAIQLTRDFWSTAERVMHRPPCRSVATIGCNPAACEHIECHRQVATKPPQITS
jgi:hypothetical protein